MNVKDFGRTAWRRTAAALAALALTAPCAGAAPASSPAPVRAGRPAPPLSLKDTDGRTHSLAEWRGRPVALFFFCGCDPCHQAGSLWSQAPGVGETGGPATVVVFSGGPTEARTFAAQTHLNGGRAVLLLDPQERAADRYGVGLCPRVFVLDAAQAVRYTNDEPGSNPQKTPAIALVSRALTALQAASPKTTGGRLTHAR